MPLLAWVRLACLVFVAGCSRATVVEPFGGTSAPVPCEYRLVVDREIASDPRASRDLMEFGTDSRCGLDVIPGNSAAILRCTVRDLELRFGVSCVRTDLPSAASLRIAAGRGQQAQLTVRSARTGKRVEAVPVPSPTAALGSCRHRLLLVRASGDGVAVGGERSVGPLLQLGPSRSCRYEISRDGQQGLVHCELDGVDLVSSTSCVEALAPSRVELGLWVAGESTWNISMESVFSQAE